MPPPAATTKCSRFGQMLKAPVIAAVRAAAYRISDDASLSRLSPSTIATSRRGRCIRSRIAALASSSVGATIAPSTKAIAHGIAGIVACATTATIPVVAQTRPIAKYQMRPALSRITSVGAEIASQYNSGGRKMTSTRLGSRVSGGKPGMKPMTSPPSTSVIG